MSKKTIHVEKNTHEKVKILSAKTDVPIGKIIELLINGASEVQILSLEKKKKNLE